MTTDAYYLASTMMLCTVMLLGALYGLQPAVVFKRKIAMTMWVLVALMVFVLVKAW